MRRRRSPWVAAVALAIVPLSGCGSSKLNAHEPKGTFDVQVLKASFPASQAVARPAQLKLVVRNTGSRTVPNMAVTVSSFYYRSDYPKLADAKRPIWVVEQGPGAVSKRPIHTETFGNPGNNVTAYTNTWSAGAVPAGQTRTFVWDVVPVKAGAHTVTYSVAAGLNGNARGQFANGASPTGHLQVHVASAPSVSHVDPQTGAVVPGPVPIVP